MSLIKILKSAFSTEPTKQNIVKRQRPIQATTQELSAFLSQVGEVVFSTSGENIQNEGISWLADKRSKFSGKEYIEQLEKNAIYTVESISLALPSLVTFIITDHDLNQEFIFQHIGNGQELARDKVGFHVQYLESECDGCIVHKDHARYEGLKGIKSSGDLAKYVDELEFWCTFYRSMQSFIMGFLDAFVHNTNSFKVYKDIDEETVKNEVEKYVKLYSNQCIGNITVTSA